MYQEHFPSVHVIAFAFQAQVILLLHLMNMYLMQLTSLPHVTNVKRIMGGNPDTLCISTGEQFVSSFLTSARDNFTFLPRMHKVSTGSNASLKQISLPAGLIDAVSWQIASLCLRSIDRDLSCHLKWRRSIRK